MCRGALALASQCSDKNIASELLDWAREKDNGNPWCTEALEDTRFANVIGGIAESHHLGRCLDAVFVGTEEAEGEGREPIDRIDDPRDEVAPDDTEAFDDD